MPITHKYTLICDEVRQENNGKFIVIGLYTNDMVVPQIPFVLPSLTFFVFVDSDRPGNYPFKLKFEQLESGKSLAEGMGMVQFQKPGIASYPIRLGNVQLANAGTYTFSLSIEDMKGPIIVAFNVIIGVVGPQPQQQQLSGM